jgi:hypothetical protein
MFPETGSRTIQDARREQRMNALKLANDKRTQNAQLKRLVGNQEVDPIDVLNQRDHPWYEVAGSMKIQDFLLCIRGFGTKTVEEILGEFSVSGKIKINRLSAQRRRELIHLIRLLQAK